MKDYDMIINMYDGYNSTSREYIINKLKEVIASRKNAGMEVDRYVALPRATGKSKHTVMSWFQRENKKIPLQHLCTLADYLDCNINFFIDLPYADYGDDVAKRFADLYNRYKNISKTNLVHNIEKFYGTADDIISNHSNKRISTIIKACECTTNTYHAWFNLSRTTIKIPLVSLAKLAKSAGVNIEEFLTIEEK